MGKHFEVLGVLPGAEKAYNDQSAETIHTFQSKEALFKGEIRRLKIFGAEDTNNPDSKVLMAQQDKGCVTLPVTAHVIGRLVYAAKMEAAVLDLHLAKELGNQVAKADLVVDGEVLAKDLPVNFLLSLESRLTKDRARIQAAPTREPTYIWHQALDTEGKVIWHVYQSDPSSDTTTKRVTEHKLLPQTKAGIPDGYVPMEFDKVIGSITVIRLTGKMPVEEKAALLTKVDMLLTAVKQARQRANDIEARFGKCGDAILGWLYGTPYSDAGTLKFDFKLLAELNKKE